MLVTKNARIRLVGLLLVGLLLAGCDKCGNSVKFNAPSLPKACGDNARS